jgi:hypothetical protein
MTAALAAGYTGEPSADAFRRGVHAGLYPKPSVVPGKGERWLIDKLDRALDALHGKGFVDAADAL